MWVTSKRQQEPSDQLPDAAVAYTQFRKLMSQRGHETASAKLVAKGLAELVQSGSKFNRQAARWVIPSPALEAGVSLYVAQTKGLRENLATPESIGFTPNQTEQYLFGCLQMLSMDSPAITLHDGQSVAVQIDTLQAHVSIGCKRHFFSKDRNGRLYSAVTSMRKTLRPMLRVDGRKLTQVDVTACGPCLLSKLVTDRHSTADSK